MPLSSGGDMSVSISPPCSWRCAHGGGRWSGAGDGGAVVFVYLVAPRHPHLLISGEEDGRRNGGCEDTGGRGSGRIVDRRERRPSDCSHTHKHTFTPTHRSCTCQSSCGRPLPGSPVSLYPSPRRCWMSLPHGAHSAAAAVVWEAHRSGLNLFNLGWVLGKKRS